ncbi:hypothetical protein HK099_008485 [Clydaea vesicula]|uniref:Uncharacterized protein n=1 Tax=Clydaea vesicula TaxID=447962 RepID=A0AAD5TVE2_9FUNG|nr:hypothetical protein HK099_008485 [Clydaea vesicula]
MRPTSVKINLDSFKKKDLNSIPTQVDQGEKDVNNFIKFEMVKDDAKIEFSDNLLLEPELIVVTGPKLQRKRSSK